MVTSLEYIKKVTGGNEVEISGWETGTPFVCMLKRVSLIALVSNGSIPNPLMSPVMALFDGDQQKIDKINAKEMSDIIELFCKNTMVEPKYEEVQEYLTDVQRTEIFNFAQGGLSQLSTFRKQRTNLVGDNNGNGLPQKTKRNTKPKP